MKKLMIIMLALMLVFAFAACAAEEPAAAEDPAVEDPAAESADDSWTRIQEQGYFILGLDDSFPPMGFRDENNEIVGFDIDMANAVAEYLGVSVELKPVVWATVITSLTSGEIDCIWNGMSVTEERLQQIDVSEPYVNSDQIIVVPAGSDIATKADMAGKIVGTQMGSSTIAALDNDPDTKASFGELKEYDTFTAAMMDLDAGRLDAVVIDGIAFYGDFNVKSPGAYTVLEENFASEQMAIGVRKEDDAWTDKLNEAMNALKADGTAAEISIKWFGEDIVI
ncbi:MAG: amino acid ABC transporter substrate-binding protein [Bacillota bacterium]|nr:amino acid ABC transporter substrate-binding protein [Bacillota bacterium]